eukprot:1127618_1
MSTNVRVNKRLGITKCMEFLIFGLYDHQPISMDIVNLVSLFFGGLLHWKICDQNLDELMNKRHVHLVSKSFMFDDLTFVCHLIRDKFIGFYWTIRNYPTKYDAVEVRYQLQCLETRTFWHFKSILLSEDVINQFNIIPFDGNGWPFEHTLQASAINHKLTCLHFTCFITNWKPLNDDEFTSLDVHCSGLARIFSWVRVWTLG